MPTFDSDNESFDCVYINVFDSIQTTPVCDRLFAMSRSKFVKEIRNRSLNIPTWILVLYSIAIGLSWQLVFNIVFSLLKKPESQSCLEPYPEDTQLYIVILVQYVAFPFLFPITGWIADTKIGREKAIRLSLWCCWIGTMLQTLSYSIQYGTCGMYANIAKYGISSVSFVLLAIGVAFFLSNILAHGLDQLVYKSNAQIRSFTHWIVWGWFVGESTNYISHAGCSIYNSKLMMGTSVVSLIVISAAVCCDIFFKKHFIYSGVLQNNPYKTVYMVLKYSYQHKNPENRSSTTFWESQVPDRLDLGKEKYGGPFIEERVESVKTLGRITIVLLSMFGFHIAYFVTVVNISGLHVSCTFDDKTQLLHNYMPFLYFNIFDKLIIIIIPLLELVIYPMFPKLEYFCLNSLRSFGITYTAMLLSLLAISVIRMSMSYSVSNLDLDLSKLVDNHFWTSTSFSYYWIPFVLSGLADSISLIFVFQFISSQAPVDMSGILSGLFWFLRGSFINMGSLIQYPFRVSQRCKSNSLCIMGIVVIELLCCVVGFLVYIYAVWKYKQRKKETEYDVHRIVEDTYTRVLNDPERKHVAVCDTVNDYNLLFKNNY